MARVLVIDDDPLVGKMIHSILVANGHTVIVADGGRAALPALETFAFDVVMVDIVMPDINGLDVIKMVREGAADVAIVAMSGYAFDGGSSDRDYFHLAQKFGANHCLQKPFKPRDLIDAIEACRDIARRSRASMDGDRLNA
jgi:CheY-like chemotaxis protein